MGNSHTLLKTLILRSLQKFSPFSIFSRLTVDFFWTLKNLKFKTHLVVRILSECVWCIVWVLHIFQLCDARMRIYTHGALFSSIIMNFPFGRSTTQSPNYTFVGILYYFPISVN